MKLEVEKTREKVLESYDRENKKTVKRLEELREELAQGEDPFSREKEIQEKVEALKKERRAIDPILMGAARIVIRIDELVDNKTQQGLLDKKIAALRQELKDDPDLLKRNR